MKNNKIIEIANQTFDVTYDKIESFIVSTVEESVEQHSELAEEDKYEAVIDPVLAAFTAVLSNYYSQIGYPKGLLLERVCDFYLESEEVDNKQTKNLTVN